MSYTEIPTDLLLEAHDVVRWIDNEFGRADACELVVEIKHGDGQPVDPGTYDFVARFTAADMERMQPLLKWLEYIVAEWGAELESRMAAKVTGR